jgi:sugar lactone lactonase YvrE
MNRETPISFGLPTFRRFAACCLSALMVCWGLAASAQITFTGTQVSLASGSWSTPTSVAVDGADNVYVADSGSNQVLRMANTSGGLGQPVVIDTQVSNPRGVAADFYGNLFLSDSGNNRVVEVPISSEGYGSPKQLVSGLNNPSGLAVDSLGNVLVADTGNNRVIEIPVVAGGYGALEVVATGLSNPLDVAVDAARNLFVADTGNGRVIKAPFVAGQYASQQVVDSGLIPVSVFVDRYNNLFIGDGATSRLVEKTWASWANRYGIQYLLGSNLVSPSSIAVDSAGNVYVTDSGSGRLIQLVSQSLNFGAVGAGSTGSQLTYNFTVDAGTTLGGVAISMQGAVGRDFSDAGGSSCVPQTYAVATICGVNVNFQPTASGTRMGAINLFDGSGDPLATAFFSGTGVRTQAAYFPGTATQLGTQLSAPSGVAVDGAGNLFIADTGNDRVVMLPWTGSGFGSQSVLPIAGISSPMGLAIDGAGDLYIASSGNDRVFRVPKSLAGFGTPSRVGTGLDGPMGVAIDSSGLLYIADTLNARVDKLAWTGNGFGTEQEIGDVHRSPIGLAVDSVGDVYFADPYQNQLAVVDWPTILEKPQHWVPMEGVSFDAALAVDGNGNLFILDSGNNRVVMLPWTGSGFGPQETVATGFNAPLGMTIDSHGVLYVADSGNNRVVRIDFSTPGGLSFATTSVGSTSADSAKTAMVQNLGNQPMQLTSVAYPADFPEAAGGATLCAENTTLAAGQWCGIAVDFTPLSAGAPLMEAVSIGGNLLGAGQSQQAIPVSGSSVARRAQQISFASVPGVVYGAAPVSLSATASSGLPVTFTVLSGPGALAYGGQTLRVTGVGTVVVQATQAGNGQFQAAAAATVSIAVSPATLTVTPTNRNATYGSISTAFSYTITGFVLRDSVANSVTGQAALTCSASSTSAVGNYTITASQGTLAASNYIFAFAPGTLTVGKAWLHVFPAALWRSYGGSMPATNWSFTGLLNGDAPGVVTGSPLMTATANAGSPEARFRRSLQRFLDL